MAAAHVIVETAMACHPAGVLWRCRVSAVDGFFFEALLTTSQAAHLEHAP